jgi:hypothetical protein
MESDFLRKLQGFKHLAILNARHYALAAWGIGLRLDPDYPDEARFKGELIVDSVLEYRGYGLFVPWAAVLARIVGRYDLRAVWILAAAWAVLAWKRAFFYSSPFRFWTRAYLEAPGKARNQTRYAEECIREMERRLKAGADFQSEEIQELLAAARNVQNIIVSSGRKQL